MEQGEATEATASHSYLRASWLVVILFLAAGVALAAYLEFRYAVSYPVALEVTQEDETLGISPLPDVLDFGLLSRGIRQSKFVTLENEGSVGVYIVVWWNGSVSPFLWAAPSRFVLKPGTKRKVEVRVSVPANAPPGKYKGTLYVFRMLYFGL